MYSELYAAWQTEIEKPELVPLPQDFFTKVSDYLRKIKEEMRMLDKKTLKAELLGNELQNATHMAKELTHMRYRKLRKAVGGGHRIPSNTLTIEEEKMCKGLLSLGEAYLAFIRSLIQGQAPKLEIEASEEPHKMVPLRFVRAVPAVIGSDMKTYGPFAAEDVASLPADNAKIMVRHGLAVAIEVS